MTMYASEVSRQDRCCDIPSKRPVVFPQGKNLDLNAPDPGPSFPRGLSEDSGGLRYHLPIKMKDRPPPGLPQQAPTHLLLPMSPLPESSPDCLFNLQPILLPPRLPTSLGFCSFSSSLALMTS